MDSLLHRQQQTDMALSSVQQCLEVIEADTQLSDASVGAVTHARHCISICLQALSSASDSWTQLTDSHVCTTLHHCSTVNDNNTDNELCVTVTEVFVLHLTGDLGCITKQLSVSILVSVGRRTKCFQLVTKK